MYHFGLYQLDLDHEQLWRGRRKVRLTPKAFALLKYFVERHGQIIAKDELFEAVWPEAIVSDAALSKRIQELRDALQDDPRSPQYLETMHRRGFRFIQSVQRIDSELLPQPNPEAPPAPPCTSVCVGREAELGHLQNCLKMALDGARQVVWVTGEPGIGKTTLINTFIARVKAQEGLWVGQGQCIEQHGSGEPYLPVLEALGRLCRDADGTPLIDLLSHHAPTWLVQMPSLISPSQLDALSHRTSGVTQHRMLREMAEAFDMVTRLKPIVLVIEDLHWSDPSTLILLMALARRHESARLLVLATYRSLDRLDSDHPLRGVTHELSLHGHYHSLTLEGLSKTAVGSYLGERFRSLGVDDNLAHFMYQRTEGNPLFMVHMVDYLVQQGVVRPAKGEWRLPEPDRLMTMGIPETLRQLVEHQLGQINPGLQALLEVASVAGTEFSSASVAAGADSTIEAVEEQCGELVRRTQFLHATSPETWPDGTVTSRYGFVHALYRDVFYGRLSAARRTRLHQRIGEREEQGYGAQATTIASELAIHFENGHDYRRAVQYHLRAAQNALQRSGSQAAITHAKTAIALLDHLPASPERRQYELQAQAALGFALTLLNGYAAPEVGRAYSRAWTLCQQVDNTFHHLPVILGLAGFYGVRAEFSKAYELAECGLSLAQHQALPGPLAQAYNVHALTLFCLGSLKASQASLEQAMTLGKAPQSGMLPEAVDAGIEGGAVLGMILWFLGAPDQAQTCLHHTIQQARKRANPFALTMALIMASTVYQYRQEWVNAQSHAEEAVALANRHGFLYWVPIGNLLTGWALTKQNRIEDGILQIQHSLTSRRQMGASAQQSYVLALLAEAYGALGQAGEGLRQLDDAFTHVRETGERHYEAELYRLKGELLLAHHPAQPSEAEACFRQGLDISRLQQAKSIELRVAKSLGELWQRQGKYKAARDLLSPVYNGFTEGLDTADLREARVLLKALERKP